MGQLIVHSNPLTRLQLKLFSLNRLFRCVCISRIYSVTHSVSQSQRWKIKSFTICPSLSHSLNLPVSLSHSLFSLSFLLSLSLLPSSFLLSSFSLFFLSSFSQSLSLSLSLSISVSVSVSWSHSRTLSILV